MRTLNIILALFAATRMVCAKTAQESTEELINIWANLKAYPTQYTETGKIRVEDTIDMVDGTSLWEPAGRTADEFYVLFAEFLRQKPTSTYDGDDLETDRVSGCLAFRNMTEGVDRDIDDMYDDWTAKPVHRGLTSKWTKVHDLIVHNRENPNEDKKGDMNIAVLEFEAIALCLDVKTSSWMFLHLCLLKAKIVEIIAGAIISYIRDNLFWHLRPTIQQFEDTYKNHVTQVNAIRTEIRILGPSPNEEVSEKLIEIRDNLDACFNTFFELSFEKANLDLLFATAA